MTSLAQNILENFQKVTETEAKPSRSDENLNTLFYNGKAIEKEIQTEQTGEFPSWISGRVSQVVQGSSLTIIDSFQDPLFNKLSGLVSYPMQDFITRVVLNRGRKL